MINIKIRILALLILVLAFISCKKELTGIQTGQEFTLKCGQTAVVDYTSSNSMKIKFEKVLEDSRCPEGMECIVAGEVVIEIKVDGNTFRLSPMGIINVQDSLGAIVQDTTGWVEYGNHKIMLVNVDPAPKMNKKICKSSYRATLKVR
jgi:hypothetical protein